MSKLGALSKSDIGFIVIFAILGVTIILHFFVDMTITIKILYAIFGILLLVVIVERFIKKPDRV